MGLIWKAMFLDEFSGQDEDAMRRVRSEPTREYSIESSDLFAAERQQVATLELRASQLKTQVSPSTSPSSTQDLPAAPETVETLQSTTSMKEPLFWRSSCSTIDSLPTEYSASRVPTMDHIDVLEDETPSSSSVAPQKVNKAPASDHIDVFEDGTPSSSVVFQKVSKDYLWEHSTVDTLPAAPTVDTLPTFSRMPTTDYIDEFDDVTPSPFTRKDSWQIETIPMRTIQLPSPKRKVSSSTSTPSTQYPFFPDTAGNVPYMPKAKKDPLKYLSRGSNVSSIDEFTEEPCELVATSSEEMPSRPQPVRRPQPQPQPQPQLPLQQQLQQLQQQPSPHPFPVQTGFGQVMNQVAQLDRAVAPMRGVTTQIPQRNPSAAKSIVQPVPPVQPVGSLLAQAASSGFGGKEPLQPSQPVQPSQPSPELSVGAAAAKDSNATRAVCSAGSAGHPGLCNRPCVSFARGHCAAGAECPYCHMPHAGRAPHLDKRHRDMLHKLPFSTRVALALPKIRRVVTRMGISSLTDELLQSLESVAASLTLVPSIPSSLSCALGALNFRALMTAICRPADTPDWVKNDMDMLQARLASEGR